jgi:hypothetical protein
MCAKANVPTEVRKLLGYHSTAKSVIEYSRDALSEPLEWLQWVVWSILSGDFDPDATRSGRWKKGKSLHVLRFGSTNDGGSVTPIPRSYQAPAAETHLHEGLVGQMNITEAGDYDEFGLDQQGTPMPRNPGQEARALFDQLEAGLVTPGLPPLGLREFGPTPEREIAESPERDTFLDEAHPDFTSVPSEIYSGGSGSDTSSSESDGEAGEDPESDAEGVSAEIQNAIEIASASLARLRPPAKNAGLSWYRHKHWGTHHLGRRGVETHLACGRHARNRRYDKLSGRPNHDWPRCAVCFGSAEAAGLDDHENDNQ